MGSVMKTNEIYILDKYGYIEITLEKVLKEKEMSRNRLATFAQVSHDLVTRYYNNKVARIDLDIISRFCDILDCDISNLLTYHREK